MKLREMGRWMLGVVLLMTALGSLQMGELVSVVSMLLLALFTIPATSKWLQRALPFTLNIWQKAAFVVMCLLMFFVGIIVGSSEKSQQENGNLGVSQLEEMQGNSDSTLTIHYIDVGQAESLLIEQGDTAMLIDAGNNGDEDLVVNYLHNQGVDELAYVVGTHPHEDHIGGLDAVIETFEIGQILMPRVSHSSSTYEDVLLAIQQKGLMVTDPEPGTVYELGKAIFRILASGGTEELTQSASGKSGHQKELLPAARIPW